ncbi:coatomer subunit gamma [Nematocida sp. AWRm77]|nr:coatomer subunit gamma [Nematocida sp. AWRm77]
MSIASIRTKESAILGMNAFTERILVTRRCVHAVVEVLREISAVKFTELEIDTVISRLLHVFQSKDAYLRVFCYSFIRSVAHLSSGSFIAVNALVHCITTRKDGTKSEALRLLLQITPEAMLEDCSKYVQQSLIETEYSSLDASVPVLLFAESPALSEWFSTLEWMKGLSPGGALGNAVMLMHKIRPQDSREIVKSICGVYLKGYSSVVGVRYLSQYVGTNKQAQKKFESCFRLEDTDEATFIEAVRVGSTLPHFDCSRLLDGAMKGLRALLLSQSVLSKIAALRTIEILSGTPYKKKLAPLRGEIEDMLGKSSTVALLSMSILLRIGTEAMAEKISKQLPKMMAEMAESQKLSIIESVGALCEKFSTTSWGDVLQSGLYGPGSCAYKVQVVRVIAQIMKTTGSAELKDAMEALVCTYVEDSPYPRVTVEILGMLLGKSTEKYTMCLMNRMILDTESVRPAIELALAAEKCSTGAKDGAAPCRSGVEGSTALLADTENTVLVRAKEKLGAYAEVFESEQKEVSELEDRYKAEEQKSSRAEMLNRTESEFAVSVSKHVFKEFVVLKYTVSSKIDFILEEGSLGVFLDGTKISEEKIYLPGKQSKEVCVKIEFARFEDVLQKSICTTFGYSVNDNRDYEVGEVRLSAFEIVLADFVRECTAEDVEENPLHTETKEFRFSMQKGAVLGELKHIFDFPSMEEEAGGFVSKGVFVYTGDPVLARVRTKELGGGKVKAEVSVCSRNKEVRDLLFASIV